MQSLAFIYKRPHVRSGESGLLSVNFILEFGYANQIICGWEPHQKKLHGHFLQMLDQVPIHELTSNGTKHYAEKGMKNIVKVAISWH